MSDHASNPAAIRAVVENELSDLVDATLLAGIDQGQILTIPPVD